MLCLVQGITGTAMAGDRNSKINSSDGSSSSEKLDSTTGSVNVKLGMLRKSRYLYFVVIDACV